MGELVKMKIMTQDNKKSFELKINPSSLSFSKSVKYTERKAEGDSETVTKYSAHGPTTLSFDFILDSTGIAYEKIKTIKNTIDEFEDIVYKYVGEGHEPHKLQISWGDTVFFCYLHTLKYDYTLFSPSGEPLRVKISASFSNATTREEEAKKANKSSPDLSHLITLKAGETIAFWCNKIYGDFSYCKDVAEFNGITNFRNAKPGTKLMFPKLLRHG